LRGVYAVAGTFRLTSPSGIAMIDFLYVFGTVAFFALMLLYVRACDRIGRDATDGRAFHETNP
jgi:hypothetical protein